MSSVNQSETRAWWSREFKRRPCQTECTTPSFSAVRSSGRVSDIFSSPALPLSFFLFLLQVSGSRIHEAENNEATSLLGRRMGVRLQRSASLALSLCLSAYTHHLPSRVQLYLSVYLALSSCLSLPRSLLPEESPCWCRRRRVQSALSFFFFLFFFCMALQRTRAARSALFLSHPSIDYLPGRSPFQVKTRFFSSLFLLGRKISA